MTRRLGRALLARLRAPRQLCGMCQAVLDTQDLIDGVRLAWELIRQPARDRYRGAELTPGPDVRSDREIEAFVRQRTDTWYHASCTCRMGADAEAVADGEARVRAVGRLRVVDASIMPLLITGNLNAPVLMLAKKLADRICGRAPLPPSDATYYRSAQGAAQFEQH